MPKIDLVFDQLWHTEKLFVTNQEPLELSVYMFALVCRCAFHHLETNVKNSLGMELTTDLTLSFLSSVNNDFFSVTGFGCEIEYVRTTESTNILLISVRVTCTIKFNVKETYG